MKLIENLIQKNPTLRFDCSVFLQIENGVTVTYRRLIIYDQRLLLFNDSPDIVENQIPYLNKDFRLNSPYIVYQRSESNEDFEKMILDKVNSTGTPAITTYITNVTMYVLKHASFSERELVMP